VFVVKKEREKRKHV